MGYNFNYLNIAIENLQKENLDIKINKKISVTIKDPKIKISVRGDKILYD